MSAFLNYDYILMTIVGQDENVSKILSISSKFTEIRQNLQFNQNSFVDMERKKSGKSVSE